MGRSVVTALLVPRSVYACKDCGATAEAIGADVWDHPGAAKGDEAWEKDPAHVWMTLRVHVAPHPCPDAGLTLRHNRVVAVPMQEPPMTDPAAVDAELAGWRAAPAKPMTWWDREDKGLLVACLDLPRMALIGGGEL